jgi:hypothetical protein
MKINPLTKQLFCYRTRENPLQGAARGTFNDIICLVCISSLVFTLRNARLGITDLHILLTEYINVFCAVLCSANYYFPISR